MNVEQMFNCKLPKWFSEGEQITDKANYYGNCHINEIQKVYREKSFFRVKLFCSRIGIVTYIFYSIAEIRAQWIPTKRASAPLLPVK